MTQPYAPPPPTGLRTSTNAIVSLIAGITGWTLLPMLGSIVAIIFGYIAKSEIKKSNGMVTGNGMATAGLILGYVSVAMGICLACIWVLLFAGLISLPFAFPTVGHTTY